jgi:hypothetical protein
MEKKIATFTSVGKQLAFLSSGRCLIILSLEKSNRFALLASVVNKFLSLSVC